MQNRVSIVCSLSKGEEDEDGVGVMKNYSRGKNDDFFFENLDFE